MKTFKYNSNRVWEFIESRQDANQVFMTSKEIYESFIDNNPALLMEYADFNSSGSKGLHPREKTILEFRKSHSRLKDIKEVRSEIPTLYEMEYLNSSKIFEAIEVKGTDPDQLQKAEAAYEHILEHLNTGKEIDESFFSGLAGGAIGALAGPAVGKALCKALGIDEKGHLGKLLNSRLVTTAMGYALGK